MNKKIGHPKASSEVKMTEGRKLWDTLFREYEKVKVKEDSTGFIKERLRKLRGDLGRNFDKSAQYLEFIIKIQ